MPLHPGKYARLFDQKISQHNVNLWLVNTGWIGGAYGAGQRISLADTRAIIRAIVSDKLNTVETKVEPYFGLAVPMSCPDVTLPSLNPADAWRDKVTYKVTAERLAKEFDENFAQYHEDVDPARLALQPDMG
jgi:phosphoenolpyruvate carboxykinase (ATP)